MAWWSSSMSKPSFPTAERGKGSGQNQLDAERVLRYAISLRTAERLHLTKNGCCSGGMTSKARSDLSSGNIKQIHIFAQKIIPGQRMKAQTFRRHLGWGVYPLVYPLVFPNQTRVNKILKIPGWSSWNCWEVAFLASLLQTHRLPSSLDEGGRPQGSGLAVTCDASVKGNVSSIQVSLACKIRAWRWPIGREINPHAFHNWQ